MFTFGEFVKSLRIKNELTLREFCRRSGLDPGNWSKIERGVLSPPKSRQIIKEIARVFNLTEDSEDFKTLCDLAAISYIPLELISNQRVVNKLPVFFRTLRGERPTRKELEELIRILEES